MLFPVLYIAAKFVTGTRTIKPDEMDFVTNVAEFDAMPCVFGRDAFVWLLS